MVLYKAFKTHEPKISEYTFTNLFVWRETNNVLLSQIGDTILVKRKNPMLSQFVLLPPIGSNRVGDVVKELLSINGGMNFPPLYGLDRMQAESLKKEGFTIKELRDNWDYIYLVRDLIDLPGERYYTKRKNIKKCLDEYKPEYKPITKKIIEQCLQLQTKWCALRNCDAIPGLEVEHRAIKETFLHFKDLNLVGGGGVG